MIKYAYENHALELRQWLSLEQLEEFLDEQPGSSTLENEVEYTKNFYSIEIWFNWALKSPHDQNLTNTWRIGLISEQNSLSPCILPLTEADCIFVGLNDKVFRVFPSEKMVLLDFALDGLPFNSFYYCAELEIILILYEVGVMAVKKDARKIWSYSKDVVTGVNIADNHLTIDFMDSPAVNIDLRTGKLKT